MSRPQYILSDYYYQRMCYHVMPITKQAISSDIQANFGNHITKKGNLYRFTFANDDCANFFGMQVGEYVDLDTFIRIND